MTFADHAAAYARAGFEIFPLTPRGKAPATEHGLLDATTDIEQIGEWWSRNPNFNIGIRPTEGTIVLDVDPRANGSLDQLGQLPPTWTAATGGGGWHLWFRYSGKARGKLANASGIDIKSRTGYLVAPPSIHPSGNRYVWLNKTPIARLPAHLRGRVAPATITARPSTRTPLRSNGEALVRYVEQAQPGSRNHALFWAACRAHAEGGDPRLLHELVTAAAGIGLTAREIEQTMTSAARRTA
ncbi:DNA primase [Skermania sp. ID1734]|uniref:bifunctional DNA primase/polymerase n=1 Tax=Skermania sp. ID1734 TaxID=2597516 RepID=UPI00117F9AD0|nr:bifunctional DNA primase/polymerase [Skermania sp. ID1734]TSE00671.1 DNA primase [Skermania sp. ID1734]